MRIKYMQRFTLGCVITSLLVMSLAPSAALGSVFTGSVFESPAPQHHHATPYAKHYLKLRHKVNQKFGVQQAGRNIVIDGFRRKDGSVRPAYKREVKASTARYEAWIAPPPPPAPVATTSVTAAPVASSAPVTSSGGCPSYMAGEASSPDAVNPSSGASGCYQVLPSTAANYGAACADVNSGSCVAAICASEGNGAWAASGSTPCDYIKP